MHKKYTHFYLKYDIYNIHKFSQIQTRLFFENYIRDSEYNKK